MQNTILKWAGNKTRMMDDVLAHLPYGERLVEPFAGSCSVMMNTEYPAYLIADVNPDLINLYRQIKEHTQEFIQLAATLYQKNPQAESYYRVREEFNTSAFSNPLQRAAQFLYLNRHGYRGLCRYNRRGGFNVPFGNYNEPYFPLEEIEAFAAKAQRATFVCADFKETLPLARTGDVVYCDPPYEGTFTGYHTAGFNKDEQHTLVCMLLEVSERCPVIVSNSDTMFTRSIYRDFSVTRLQTRRSMCVAGGEGKTGRELIAVRSQFKGRISA